MTFVPPTPQNTSNFNKCEDNFLSNQPDFNGLLNKINQYKFKDEMIVTKTDTFECKKDDDIKEDNDFIPLFIFPNGY